MSSLSIPQLLLLAQTAILNLNTPLGGNSPWTHNEYSFELLITIYPFMQQHKSRERLMERCVSQDQDHLQKTM